MSLCPRVSVFCVIERNGDDDNLYLFKTEELRNEFLFSYLADWNKSEKHESTEDMTELLNENNLESALELWSECADDCYLILKEEEIEG